MSEKPVLEKIKVVVEVIQYAHGQSEQKNVSCSIDLDLDTDQLQIDIELFYRDNEVTASKRIVMLLNDEGVVDDNHINVKEAIDQAISKIEALV